MVNEQRKGNIHQRNSWNRTQRRSQDNRDINNDEATFTKDNVALNHCSLAVSSKQKSKSLQHGLSDFTGKLKAFMDFPLTFSREESDDNGTTKLQGVGQGKHIVDGRLVQLS